MKAIISVVHNIMDKNNKIDYIEKTVAFFFTVIVCLMCYVSLRMI